MEGTYKSQLQKKAGYYTVLQKNTKVLIQLRLVRSVCQGTVEPGLCLAVFLKDHAT